MRRFETGRGEILFVFLLFLLTNINGLLLLVEVGVRRSTEEEEADLVVVEYKDSKEGLIGK